jgi:multiple sugar transport system ATP-binding protein
MRRALARGVAEVRLQGISKRYEGAAEPSLAPLDLEVGSDELVVLVGPSGCGKSTTLRLVAGLEEPTAGDVWIGGRRVTTLAPADRDVAMVFQSYALYPHLTVYENLAFALRLRKVKPPELDRRVRAAADLLGLGELLARLPRQLSGGQRQRVAIGRALVREPAVFLFDEPLSNLDAQLRGELRREIAGIHRRTRGSALYVTHDQTEAMTLADRIVCLRDGRVEQVGTPLELYEAPANLFVAGFFGAPAMNFLRGAGAARVLGGERDVVVGVRPHDLEVTDDAPIGGRVELRELMGAEAYLHLESEAGRLVVRTGAHVPAREGDRVGVRVDRSKLHVFDARTEQRV